MQNEETKKTKWALKTTIVFAAIIFVCVTVFIFANLSQNDGPTVVINDTKINVEFAISSQEKEKGLCCRDNLAQNSGMLFVYDQPGKYRFWMKDTRIPLDMYWIDSSKKIIHIEHNVQPDSYPQNFGPDEWSQYILETNAGFAKRHNIQVGDSVNF